MIRDSDGNVVRNEDGTPVGSVDVNELPGAQADAESDEGSGEEDLHGLLKADLVERAEAAGIDASGKTKAELVDALEANEANEGGDHGNDSVA